MSRQYNLNTPLVTRLLAPVLVAGLVAVTGSLWAAPVWADAATGAPVSAPPRDHVVERTHDTMGTVIVLKAWGEDDAAIVGIFADAFAEFDRIDALMTTWTPDSEVSRINAAAGGKAVVVSPELVGVLDSALAASKLTGGAFDITVGAFSGVWKFDEDNDGSLPDDKLVQERRKLVSWRDVIIDHKAHSVRLRRKGQKITLGGIAKGYAVDRVTQMLRKRGLADFVVQAGGDMYVSGRRGDRRWRVGIRDPRGSRSDFFAMAEVEDATFSTSGDYERFVVKDGKRFHHILDPKTGYPAPKCRSVTVMAKDAVTAEGLTKGIFILGAEEGLKLIAKLPGVEAVVVDADNQVHVSKGLEPRLTIVHPPTAGI
jgi:thiamine biosynthesis lipoprotein